MSVWSGKTGNRPTPESDAGLEEEVAGEGL